MRRFGTFFSSLAFGYVLVALSIVNWSGNFVAARAMADILPPATLNLIRWAIATLVFLPFGIRPMWRERKAVMSALPELCLIALFGISLFDVLTFVAGSTTAALNMSLISTLSPVFTFVLAHFFLGEEMSPRTALGVFVSMCGVVVLVTGGDVASICHLTFSVGDLLMLIVACMSSGYNIFVKRVSGRLSQSAMLMSTFILGVVFIVPMFAWEVWRGAEIPEITARTWGVLVYLGVFASVLCYLFWNMAVAIIGAGRTTLFYYTIPFCSGLLAWFMLGEEVNAAQLYSGVFIFGGIIICLTRRQTPRRNGVVGVVVGEGGVS
ncbi:drug/metabolite transporter (DMT)-like permease [Desulfobaculum xiamenense]|uniref:Drug/metabolite transporter (DMT)-like permease n=1 Tax=Desulfobaculum xiamenense TaxID=995050 RepID=A0A846QM36_9BACT|nr:DMT family transporter [Desulfobaculum xiamenense]NJB66495.1 drug/metabolite transporter (DMT)-like permease [Desulfobaculum xiamenense]